MSTSDGAPDASAGNDEKRITDAVHAITERRAVIEQAKGMLMFVYGIDADQAFDVLRLQSQEHNVKLRLVAEQILKDLVELSRTKSPQRPLAFGGLLTAPINASHTARSDDWTARARRLSRFGLGSTAAVDSDFRPAVGRPALDSTGLRRNHW